MCILIIEEQKLLARDVYQHITQQRHTCDVSYDAQEGSRMNEKFTYDCVLLGINWKDDLGIDFLKRLHKLQKTAGIIIISERKSVDAKITALESGRMTIS